MTREQAASAQEKIRTATPWSGPGLSESHGLDFGGVHRPRAQLLKQIAGKDDVRPRGRMASSVARGLVNIVMGGRSHQNPEAFSAPYPQDKTT